MEPGRQKDQGLERIKKKKVTQPIQHFPEKERRRDEEINEKPKKRSAKTQEVAWAAQTVEGP